MEVLAATQTRKAQSASDSINPMIVCPVCSHDDVAVYLDAAEAELDAAMLGSSRRLTSPGRILRCRTCQFAFRQTRFAAQQLAELYRKMDPAVYQAELEGRRRTSARHLRIVQQYVSAGRILDVGCASGLFLSLAAEAGWEPTGVEPCESLWKDASMALAGKGEVHRAILEEAPLPGNHFDAVVLWDVLEHVSDPLGMLRQCRSLLKAGGWLFLNVPDLDSLEARLLGRRWPLLLAEHLNYFNRPSLQCCATKAGLELVRFGRRRVVFSLQYVTYRLWQHGIPGARLAHRALQSHLGRLLVPVSLGETYAVWRAV